MKKFLLGIVIFLSACNSHNKIAKVHRGMNAGEVATIMGQPSNKTPVFGSIVWWLYGDNQMIVMDADTVVNVVADVKATTDSMKTIMNSNK